MGRGKKTEKKMLKKKLSAKPFNTYVEKNIKKKLSAKPFSTRHKNKNLKKNKVPIPVTHGQKKIVEKKN